MFVSKNFLPGLIILFLADNVFCQVAAGSEPLRIEGRTMGTTYAIVYFDEKGREFKRSIDSLLQKVNSAISNYDPTSSVSAFNKSTGKIQLNSYHFEKTLRKSLEISRASKGNFDPTVMPLVNLWGFGPVKNLKPTREKIDSLKKFVGYDHITLRGKEAHKDHPNVQLDFGGIGQGYGIDVISNFLKAQGIRNFLVELGGEGFAYGKNLKTNTSWRIGIVNPLSPREEPELIGYAFVENGAFTTSGNYLNYRIIDGKKYGHTISPFTGFPIQQDLISVSVFSADCATADAWDTAFMVAGREKSIELLKANPHLAAILISQTHDKLNFFVSDTIRDKVFLESHDH